MASRNLKCYCFVAGQTDTIMWTQTDAIRNETKGRRVNVTLHRVRECALTPVVSLYLLCCRSEVYKPKTEYSMRVAKGYGSLTLWLNIQRIYMRRAILSSSTSNNTGIEK